MDSDAIPPVTSGSHEIMDSIAGFRFTYYAIHKLGAVAIIGNDDVGASSKQTPVFLNVHAP